MEKGRKYWRFAIFHLPFAIQDAFFSILPRADPHSQSHCIPVTAYRRRRAWETIVSLLLPALL
jgi:hypothetical protein